jgi:hypothetical protein
MRKEHKKYEGQALAIAMVVLVVSAIIGISIYSRTFKDRMLTMGERASSEALEVSDLIIDHLTKVPLDDIITYLETNHPYDDDDDPDVPGGDINFEVGVTLEESSKNEISNMISSLTSATNIFTGLNFCQLGNNSSNEYYLNIKKADENAYFEIRAGQVVAFPIKGEYMGDDCNTTIKVAMRGDSRAGFSLSKVYGLNNYSNSYTTKYKIYQTTDEEQYCFATGITCNNSDFQSDVWNKYISASTITLNDIGESVTFGGESYLLDEIRIRAIGGTIGVSIRNINCITDFEMMEITAAANCNGVYRGKTIMIPAKKWGSPLFDYIIFNGEGSL